MSLHFPLPKIRTSRFSLHTSRLSFHGEFTIVALKIAMSSPYFPLPKIFFALFVPPLSNGTTRATSDWKPKTNDQILPSPIFLPIEKLNQINTKKLLEIEKEIVREVARGDKPYLRKIYRSQSTNQEGVRSVLRTDLCFAICRFLR